MPRKKKPTIEIVPASEAALVPQLPAVSPQAMFERMVRQFVGEIMAEKGADLLEPDFRSKEVAYEIQRRGTIFDRQKGALYFEKWGCKRCSTRTHSHASNGYCDRCKNLLTMRLLKIKRRFDADNPDNEINRQIDRLTSRMRSAQELLGEGQ